MTISHEEYDALPAINWSSLKHIGVSPFDYQWHRQHPVPRKPAFIFGGAVHCAILEPEKFDARYAVFDGTRNAKHKEWQAWQAEHPGVESLKSHELARVKAIAKSVMDHRVAKELLKGGRREEPQTWVDEATGLACKGRFDYVRPEFVLDLKSSHNPAPARFERDALAYGYGGQVAFYHDGATRLRLIDGRTRPFIIAVQSKAPFHVVAFQLEPETLEAGRALYRSLLRRLIECTEANYWPGLAPELQPLRLPPWAEGQLLSQEDEEEAF
jgi:hypothetical protein